MKKSLALMFAFSGLAAAAAPAHAASIIGEFTPIVLPPRGGGCTASLNEKKTLSKNLAGGTTGPISWTLGASAGVGMYADCNRLTAEGSVGLDATMFDGLTVKPLEVKLSANTKSTGNNSLEWSVYAFGFEVKKQPIVESATPISGADSMGYMLPMKYQSGTLSYSPDWAGSAMGSVGYTAVGQVAAAVIWKASPTEVSARAITSGNASASLKGSITYKGFTYNKTVPFDIFRLTQGGRAVLKQVSGTQWKAEAANTISLTDVLNASMCWDIPLLGTKCLFKVDADEWADDYSVSKTFTKAF
jgi:hypothetical protein